MQAPINRLTNPICWRQFEYGANPITRTLCFGIHCSDERNGVVVNVVVAVVVVVREVVADVDRVVVRVVLVVGLVVTVVLVV